MAKKILSVSLVLVIVLSCFLVNTISVSALSQADLYFTVNGNGENIYIYNQNGGNGVPTNLGSSAFTVNSSNYGYYGWIDSANNKAYYALVVYLSNDFSIATYDSDGSTGYIFDQSDLGQLPSTSLLGFIAPMENGGLIKINYDGGSGSYQRMIYLEFDITDDTPAPSPEPDEPDNPNIETDSDILFNIYRGQNYNGGIMVDGAERVFYYDTPVNSFSCGFNSSNHAPLTELNGHVKKYKVTLYNVPDGSSLSFDSPYGLTVVETSQASSEYTYIVNDDYIPDLTLNITYSSDDENIWEMYTIWIVVRDTYAQGYYVGYDVGYDVGYEKAIDDIGRDNIGNAFIQVITEPIRAIMSFQLAEFNGFVITIGNIFYTIFGILLVIIFLKLFAGG